MGLILIIISILLFITEIVCLVFSGFLLWAIFFTKVPFVSIPKEVLPEIVNNLQLDKNSKLYDLGCGDGRVLIECYKHCPEATYIGIEKDIIPIIFAKINLWRFKNPHNIHIIRNNFLKQNISDASHIFTYLSNKMMDNILPKLEKEAQEKTILISCDFSFSKKKPIKIINLNRPPKSLGTRILKYIF